MSNGNGKNGGLILNGLKGSDLIVYNLLCRDCNLSAAQIADMTCYTYWTVRMSLARLSAWQLITRQRQRRGQRYQCTVME